MGTAGLGRVLELWLLGPDVVVEPGEKLADTRAAERRARRGRSSSHSDTFPPPGGKIQSKFTIGVIQLKFTFLFEGFEDSVTTACRRAALLDLTKVCGIHSAGHDS